VVDATVVEVLVVVPGEVVVVVDATVVEVLVVVPGEVVVVVDATVVEVLVVVPGEVVVVVDDGEASATGTSTVASPQAPDSSRVRTLLSAGSIESPHRYFTATQRCR